MYQIKIRSKNNHVRNTITMCIENRWTADQHFVKINPLDAKIQFAYTHCYYKVVQARADFDIYIST